MPHVGLVTCLLFAGISVLAIVTVNRKDAWKALLFTGLVFYALVSIEGILVVLAITGLTYGIAPKLADRSIGAWSIFLILIPLVVKKALVADYGYEMFASPVRISTQLANLVGLSYVTFNAVSYLMDVKRKYAEPESDPFRLLLYLTYFPIIFSGPLTRVNHFFSELKRVQLDRNAMVSGLRSILWGVFKNSVVGARLMILMNVMLEMNLSGPYYLLVGFVFYLFLYCTFSSFINIMQGISLMFNIRIKDNFRNRVYVSSSREQFWNGWHITLNRWFRDYFFYELIRSDKKHKYTDLLLFVTFICIALWHDLTWVFLTWGVLNAVWLIAERKVSQQIRSKRRYPILGVMYHTFFASFLATVFISNDLYSLFNTLSDFSFPDVDWSVLFVPSSLLLLFLFLFMDFYERRSVSVRIDEFIGKQHWIHRYFFYYTLSLLILFFSISPDMLNYYNMF